MSTAVCADACWAAKAVPQISDKKSVFASDECDDELLICNMCTVIVLMEQCEIERWRKIPNTELARWRLHLFAPRPSRLLAASKELSLLTAIHSLRGRPRRRGRRRH